MILITRKAPSAPVVDALSGCRMTRISIMLMLACSSAAANASPTSSDFIPCQKLAEATLERCLSVSGEDCLAISEKSYNDCHGLVVRSYTPDPARIEAAKRLEAEREAR